MDHQNFLISSTKMKCPKCKREITNAIYLAGASDVIDEVECTCPYCNWTFPV
jgi:DNA-directed RNA polymerase subunit RPC12/RpoP